MELVRCVLALALIVGGVACTEKHSPERHTTERKTMGWPPSGAEPSRWDGAEQIPGLEIYIVRDDSPRTWGAAREVGANTYMTGKSAFDAARARVKDPSPAFLAELAMLFLDDQVAGQKPWTGPGASARAPEEQAAAEPPAVRDGVLEYWRFHAQLAGMVRCRVQLDAGAVSCELATKILRERALADDPMAVIEAELAADDIPQRTRAIEQLAAMGTPESRERLHALALNQAHYRVREAAVNAIASLRNRASTATLSRILLYDGHAEVRRAAAIALGQLGDPAGRDALERAAEGDGDGKVRGEAQHALTLLE